MRSAFSMIVAIATLVMIATIMALSLSLSSQSAKETGSIYLQQQAQLYARSATEFAIFWLSGNPCATSPLNLQIEGQKYLAKISFMHITTEACASGGDRINTNLSTAESNATVIIDTMLEVNQTIFNLSEPIVVHRRTLQKP